MVDKVRLQDLTKDLKFYFIGRKITTSEARETMFRLIEYIDNYYPADGNVHFHCDPNSLNEKLNNGN
jgi:hypothetical protein